MPASSGLTPAEHAMLGLVLLGPRHGYEIAAHFGPEGDLGIVCQLPMSLLYAQLKRLESLGYLEGTTEFQANRPDRPPPAQELPNMKNLDLGPPLLESSATPPPEKKAP